MHSLSSKDASTSHSESSDEDQELRAADGRVPGRRGLATRQRLLECTTEMLRTSSYRDLKVVDIAREAGTSPATFYQYFPDVESAIFVLAEEMVAEGGDHFAHLVTDANWKGKGAYEASEALADAILTFWAQHQPVLRVVDIATDEGDARFANVRTRLLNGLNNALAGAARSQQASGKGQEGLDPNAIAGVLVAMLAHVSSHRLGFEFWGVRTDELKATMARIIAWSITGQKPAI
ncbi:MAG: TetR/AcrR family transcriptional regulator [Acidimicrobiales bacterium]|nr:TetR/AcrR family transcriptional regulator [Acidimicrobiales bacterium]